MDFLYLGVAFLAYVGFVWLFLRALFSFDLWLGKTAAQKQGKRNQGPA